MSYPFDELFIASKNAEAMIYSAEGIIFLLLFCESSSVNENSKKQLRTDIESSNINADTTTDISMRIRGNPYKSTDYNQLPDNINIKEQNTSTNKEQKGKDPFLFQPAYSKKLSSTQKMQDNVMLDDKEICYSYLCKSSVSTRQTAYNTPEKAEDMYYSCASSTEESLEQRLAYTESQEDIDNFYSCADSTAEKVAEQKLILKEPHEEQIQLSKSPPIIKRRNPLAKQDHPADAPIKRIYNCIMCFKRTYSIFTYQLTYNKLYPGETQEQPDRRQTSMREVGSELSQKQEDGNENTIHTNARNEAALKLTLPLLRQKKTDLNIKNVSDDIEQSHQQQCNDSDTQNMLLNYSELKKKRPLCSSCMARTKNLNYHKLRARKAPKQIKPLYDVDENHKLVLIPDTLPPETSVNYHTTNKINNRDEIITPNDATYQPADINNLTLQKEKEKQKKINQQSIQKSPLTQNDFDFVRDVKKILIKRHVCNAEQKIDIKNTKYIDDTLQMKTKKMCNKDFIVVYSSYNYTIITSTGPHNDKEEGRINIDHMTTILNQIVKKLLQSEECKKTIHIDNFLILCNRFEKAFADKQLNVINPNSFPEPTGVTIDSFHLKFPFLLYLEYLCLFLEDKNIEFINNTNEKCTHRTLFEAVIKKLSSSSFTLELSKQTTNEEKNERIKHDSFMSNCLSLRKIMHTLYSTSSITDVNGTDNESLKLYLIGSITLDTIIFLMNLTKNYSKIMNGNKLSFDVNFDLVTNLSTQKQAPDFETKCSFLKKNNIYEAKYVKETRLYPNEILLIMLYNYLDLLFLPITFIPKD